MIVDLVGRSVPTEEMWEVFSAGICVNDFMLEMASSDGDTKDGMSLARGPTQAWRMRTWEDRRGRPASIEFRAMELVFLFAVFYYPVILPRGHHGRDASVVLLIAARVTDRGCHVPVATAGE